MASSIWAHNYDEKYQTTTGIISTIGCAKTTCLGKLK